ncbi:hypothetical protein LIER_15402 [Lithospermum erythrorhizon]|uniref:Uncharacterized protein n=1 Tax=Lithospermum erythrorhizon TaxID=34254 RepID=A0AAV3Q2Q0_LITER
MDQNSNPYNSNKIFYGNFEKSELFMFFESRRSCCSESPGHHQPPSQLRLVSRFETAVSDTSTVTKFIFLMIMVFLTGANSLSTLFLHLSKRVVLAFSDDGSLYPFGALLRARAISMKSGFLNILNGIPFVQRITFKST